MDGMEWFEWMMVIFGGSTEPKQGIMDGRRQHRSQLHVCMKRIWGVGPDLTNLIDWNAKQSLDWGSDDGQRMDACICCLVVGQVRIFGASGETEAFMSGSAILHWGIH